MYLGPNPQVIIATPTDPGSMKAIQEEEWIDPDYNPDGSAPLPECIGRETWRARCARRR